jgi:hypothetical protein
VLGRHRLIDVGPLRPLTSQSPLLARLAREPRATRTADPLRNLPMRVGLAPISYYRTLNLPAVESLSLTTLGLMSGPIFEPRVRAALRATGTSLRIFHPVENRVNQFLKRPDHAQETIEDPALADWLYGASWTAGLGPWVRRFAIWHSEEPPIRAWLVSFSRTNDTSILDEWSGDPREILALLDRAQPLAADYRRPEAWTISVPASGKGWVILSQLAEPQWKARWIGLDGQGEYSLPILPTFRKKGEPGGWQRLEIPGEGRWTLHLDYEPRDVVEGLAISMIAWVSWLIVGLNSVLRSGTRRPRTRPDKTGA